MAAGIVRNHAVMMLAATPHLTAESLLVAPTPMIEPVIVWVVLTGMPARVLAITVMAPAVSALKPCTGLKSVNPLPRVLITFHPPR